MRIHTQPVTAYIEINNNLLPHSCGDTHLCLAGLTGYELSLGRPSCKLDGFFAFWGQIFR